MSILFISDVHLCHQKHSITAGFLYFLRTRAIHASALYILGDLFDIWIGDDDPNPLNNIISSALKELRQYGIPCYFIHGNHDFLIDKHHAAAYGMILLPSQRILQFNGHRIIILHGDTLCTNDISYQNFRRKIHQRWLQKLFLDLPFCIRKKITGMIRAKSINGHSIKTTKNFDVNLQTVMSLMMHTNTSVMIHGHTHQPAIHYLPGNRLRVVLGAWNQQGSVIEVNEKNVTLFDFTFFD
ncbi:UDP-2,3-diacylglucosamine diphosphatase [Candidatus Curculioniphilus buchneri]|uniref:UDP-2,3-diacylglucosamine diphosphatase n=1 Tax=Candidatus Curculioniphilus buchneri TaxID=690594 RepID=UPI00376F4475